MRVGTSPRGGKRSRWPAPVSTSPHQLLHAEDGHRSVHHTLGGAPLLVPENQRREQVLRGVQPGPVVHYGQTAGFVGRAARSCETIVSALPALA